MSVKNSKDTIGNRSRDLPVCSVCSKVGRIINGCKVVTGTSEIVKSSGNPALHCLRYRGRS
jgi:hypothetical protein